MYKRFSKMMATTLTLTLCLSCMTGCGQTTGTPSQDSAAATTTAPATTAPSTEIVAQTPTTEAVTNTAAAAGGVLLLSVNPQLAISYDGNGMVTSVTSRNDAGTEILKNYAGFQGKECRVVAAELIAAIGQAGYFANVSNGQGNPVTITIEGGSKLPNGSFIDGVIADVRNCLSNNKWASAVQLNGESDYGMSDYVDTDYGTGNDGYTDYNDTDYGPNNDGDSNYSNHTDYNNNTDYGPSNDGDTDYNNDTDYGPNNDGDTDYNQQATTKAAKKKKQTTEKKTTTKKNTGGDSGYSNYNGSDYGSDYDD